jgi:2,3-bisphosphoglycerate-dependent phosphoglycerate mutase
MGDADSTMNARSTVFLVRHCQSTGQEPDAPLTDLGHQQAARLADVLADAGIRRIVSSPYTRARQSIEPLAVRLGLPVETDERLIERVLAGASLPDWRERIRASFDDLDVALPGGESSRVAMARAASALADVLGQHVLPAVMVSHGNLLAALLHHLDGRPGFETWSALSNPDVFGMSLPDGVVPDAAPGSAVSWTIERLWRP